MLNQTLLYTNIPSNVINHSNINLMKRRTNFKLVFLIALVCFIGTDKLKAQAGELSYGAKVGASFSGFTHYQNVFTNYKTGVTAGAVAMYNPINVIGVGVELNYLQQGAAEVDQDYVYIISPDNVTGAGCHVTIHTLNIPVIVSFNPLVDNIITPRVYGGFALDLHLSANTKNLTVIDGVYSTNLSKDNVSGAFSTTNLSPLAGIEFDMDAGSFTYFIDFRYKVGLQNISAYGTLNTTQYLWDYSINTFTASFGVKLK